jgi:uncharacterized membrane protein
MKPARLVMGVLYIAAGALHFLFISRYLAVMPPCFPAHRALVFISGAAEIAAGLGVLSPIPILRRAAAWGLVALLIAVLPANVYMLTSSSAFPSIPLWVLWARLPMQLPLIYWAWLYTKDKSRSLNAS